MLDRLTIRPAGDLRISGRSVCVRATTAKKFVSNVLPEDLGRHRGRRVEAAGRAEVGVLQRDARVVHQDVELAVAVLQEPGDLLVVLGPGHVEPDGLDVLDPLGLQLLGGGAALRLVAAADDDGDAQLAEPSGRLQADPLVRPGDERDLVLRLPWSCSSCGWVRYDSAVAGSDRPLTGGSLPAYTNYMEDVKQQTAGETPADPDAVPLRGPPAGLPRGDPDLRRGAPRDRPRGPPSTRCSGCSTAWARSARATWARWPRSTRRP